MHLLLTGNINSCEWVYSRSFVLSERTYQPMFTIFAIPFRHKRFYKELVLNTTHAMNNPPSYHPWDLLPCTLTLIWYNLVIISFWNTNRDASWSWWMVCVNEQCKLLMYCTAWLLGLNWHNFTWVHVHHKVLPTMLDLMVVHYFGCSWVMIKLFNKIPFIR